VQNGVLLGKRKPLADASMASQGENAFASPIEHPATKRLHLGRRASRQPQFDSVLGKRRHNDELLGPSSRGGRERDAEEAQRLVRLERAEPALKRSYLERMDLNAMALVVYQRQRGISDTDAPAVPLRAHTHTPLLLHAPAAGTLGKRSFGAEGVERRCRQRFARPPHTLSTAGLVPSLRSSPSQLPVSLEHTAYMGPLRAAELAPAGGSPSPGMCVHAPLSLHHSTGAPASFQQQRMEVPFGAPAPAPALHSTPLSYFSIEEIDQDGDDVIQDVTDPEDNLELRQSLSADTEPLGNMLTSNDTSTSTNGSSGLFLANEPFANWGGAF
jgi:hypothetical protein